MYILFIYAFMCMMVCKYMFTYIYRLTGTAGDSLAVVSSATRTRSSY